MQYGAAQCECRPIRVCDTPIECLEDERKDRILNLALYGTARRPSQVLP
jgi:hypothetical protein